MTNIKKIAAALSMMVLFAANSFAGMVNKTTLPIVVEDPTIEPLSVNYMGEDANYLYFQVSVKSGRNKFVAFAVSDKAEGELYAASFSTDKVQTLKIEKRDNQELDFNLRVGNKHFSKSFTIMPKVTLEKL